ncbi:hypothetical protein F5Y07DRAFT_46103 [Xylaria sp. FL0933]|nr:hypothetical protein F5Y07DRAFT_46103 [Xylaria sp. FL0933]
MASALTESLPFVMGGNNIRYGFRLAFSTWFSVGTLVLLVKVKREWCFGVLLLDTSLWYPWCSAVPTFFAFRFHFVRFGGLWDALDKFRFICIIRKKRIISSATA